MHGTLLLEAEEGKLHFGLASLAAHIIPRFLRVSWNPNRWGNTIHQTEDLLFLLGSWGVGGWYRCPDRYFYIMQSHFCLNLPDPLILWGTLFLCDVKTPELEMLFLISFQKLKTLFRAESDNHQARWRWIIPWVIMLAYKSTEEALLPFSPWRSWVTNCSRGGRRCSRGMSLGHKILMQGFIAKCRLTSKMSFWPPWASVFPATPLQYTLPSFCDADFLASS